MADRPINHGLPAAGLLLLVFLAVAGCSHSRSGGWSQGGRFKNSTDYLNMALEAECADDRREGVIGLARSRDAAADWAVKVFDTIARTDTDAMVRCEAVKALGRSAGPRHLPTLLKLLNSSANTSRDRQGAADTSRDRDGQDTSRDREGAVHGVRPAPGRVRWEAAKLLKTIVEEHGVAEEQRQELLRILLDRLAKDDDRNVRLAVIEALAYLRERAVVIALIDALETDDFTIKHSAERSLILLTGATHNRDAEAWRVWLAGTDDPCKEAGSVSPDSLEVKKKRWWEYGWDW